MVVIKIDDLIKELMKARFEDDFRYAEIFIMDPIELEPGIMSKKSLVVNFSDGYGGCIEGFDLDNIDDFRWDWKYLEEVVFVNKWLIEEQELYFLDSFDN